MASLFSRFSVRNSFNLAFSVFFLLFYYSWGRFSYTLPCSLDCCLRLFVLVPRSLPRCQWSWPWYLFCFVYFYFHWIFRRGEPDESIGTIADTRMNHQYPQTCFGSSEYELALILKELRWITDQVNWIELNRIRIQYIIQIPFAVLVLCVCVCAWARVRAEFVGNPQRDWERQYLPSPSPLLSVSACISSPSDCANLCACVLMERPMSRWAWRCGKEMAWECACVYACVWTKSQCLHLTDLIQCDYLDTAKTRGRR